MKKNLLLTMVMVALVTAIIASTKTSIKPSDLPKAVTEDISKNYSGYSIKEAFKVENKGVTQFEVLVQKANNKLVLIYDKEGKFVKKSSVSTLNKMEMEKPENKATPKKVIK